MAGQLPSRRLVSNEQQSMVQRPRVPRSRFINEKTRKTTFDEGFIVPFHADEVLPGDHFKFDVVAYLRMATPKFPLYDNLRIDTHGFFCPYRLVWSNWRQFMGQQATPTSSINFTIPQLVSGSGGFAVGSLADQFGIGGVAGQVTGANVVSVNALPFRAYNRIWSEWYRDQNLQSQATLETGDGPDAVGSYPLRRRNKMHDYFTTVLPWPQKFTAPSMQSQVQGIGFTASAAVAPAVGVLDSGGLPSPYAFGVVNTGDVVFRSDAAGTPQVFAEASINAFRTAILIQSLLERDARGGTRYTELIKAHFDVESPDARLQRPEYIGGGTSVMRMEAVAQTTPTTNPLGYLGAVATSAGEHKFSYAATEHGVIILMISVRAELSYQQGMHRMWTRQTRYDYPWPELAGLGEQAVRRDELYVTGVAVDDATTFGYQERYGEWRQLYSDVAGLFRSTSAGAIDEWHLAQEFGSAPALNDAWIREEAPMNRVLSAGSLEAGKQFLASILIRRDVVRPLPTYGTPASLGRF